MVDDGSNVGMLAEVAANAAKIPFSPSNIRLNTSNTSGSSILGITPAILVTYGKGSALEVNAWHYFLVTRGMDHLYHVLLPNVDLVAHGGGIYSGASTLFLRPQFDELGLQSPMLSLPTRMAEAGHGSPSAATGWLGT